MNQILCVFGFVWPQLWGVERNSVLSLSHFRFCMARPTSTALASLYASDAARRVIFVRQRSTHILHITAAGARYSTLTLRSPDKDTTGHIVRGLEGAVVVVRFFRRSVVVWSGLRTMAMYKVTMVRHGESAWNAENRFCGWFDADLAESGVEEGRKAAQVC